jgi:hypothetical protein
MNGRLTTSEPEPDRDTLLDIAALPNGDLGILVKRATGGLGTYEFMRKHQNEVEVQ